MTIGEMIYDFRTRTGMSQREFARKCGLSNATISMYEKNGVNPRTGKPFKIEYITYLRLANVMNMDIDKMFEILGDDALVGMIPNNVIPMSDLSTKKVPLIGKVAAGEPIYAEESYDTYIPAPKKADYALEIQGESMVPTYLPGDIIYIRQQPDIDYQGQVAVVILDDEATVKHVYKQSDGFLLVSDNPAYAPMHKPFADYNSVRILGKVCGYTRMY